MTRDASSFNFAFGPVNMIAPAFFRGPSAYHVDGTFGAIERR